MRRYFRILVFPCIVMLLFSSCSYFFSDNRVSGGQKLDDELMSEIKAEIFSTAQNATESEIEESCDEHDGSDEKDTSDTSDATCEESSEAFQQHETVYWTKSGEVWHSFSGCQYLKNAEVLSGSLEEALAAKKTKQCSICSSKEKN